MLDEHIEFLEAAFVEQEVQTLPCCQLAFLVLGVYPLLAATHPGGRPALNQFFNVFLLDAHIICIALFLLRSYKFTILSVSDKIQGGKDAKTFAMWRNPLDNKKGDRECGHL